MIFSKLILLTIFVIVAYNTCTNKKTNEKLFWIGLIISLSILFCYCFNIFLITNGDNAAYLILGKSLATKKGAFLLYVPEMRADSYYPLGLPFLISIIYSIFGMNIIVIKFLIFLLYCGSILFYYKILIRIFDKNISFLTIIIFSTSPFLVQYASYIMTEIPFIFFSLLSCHFAMKYIEEETINKITLSLLLFSSFMVYMVRAVGIIIFPAIILYFATYPGNIFSIQKIKIYFKSSYFKKMLYFFISFLILFVLWQIRGKSAAGESQLSMFFRTDFYHLIIANGKLIPLALPYTLICNNSISWSLHEINYIMVVIVDILLLLGMIITFKKNKLIVFYFVFLVLIYLLSCAYTAFLVQMRYMIPSVPFTLIFIVNLAKYLENYFFKNPIFKNLLIPIALLILLIINLISLNVVEKGAKKENQRPKSFIECNEWLKENVNKESVIISRKDTYTYIITGVKSSYNITYASAKIYCSDWALEQIEYMKKVGADYLIFDTFSSSSILNVYPLINDYKQHFRLIKVFNGPNPTYLFKVENL